MTLYNFDRIADRYDDTRGFPPGVAEQICEWVLSRLPEAPAILEIGVGTGRIAIPFIQRGIRYTGVDISAEMTGRLRAKLGGNLRRAQLLLADAAERLPLPDDSQDAAIAVHIFHLIDAIRALHELRRVLKPHGALIWGHERHGDGSIRHRVRQYFHETVEALGGPPRRDFFRKDARDLLASWGARVEQHTVARWVRQESCRQALESLRQRLISSTWAIPDEILQEAARRTEAWAAQEYGDLDRLHEVEERFVIDWFQL